MPAVNYLHPLLAAAVLAFFAWVASLAMRSRNDRRHAARLLRLHAALAPWVVAAVVAAWMSGAISMELLRPERTPGVSGHFRMGIALVAVMAVSALSSRRMRNPTVRSLHPWIGATAMLLAAAQVFLGLQLMR